MLIEIEKTLKEKSIIREYALEAKREGFKVVGVSEKSEVELSGGCRHQLILERFMNEDEVEAWVVRIQNRKQTAILLLEDPYVEALLKDALTAKDILQQYSYEKKRAAMLEFDKRSIDSKVIVKVTNYNPGSGGIGLEDKYSNRIEKLEAIDNELIELNYNIGRVEKALELVRDENEIGCDAMLLKHVHNDSYDAIALALNYSRRSIIYKVRAAEELFEKILK